MTDEMKKFTQIRVPLEVANDIRGIAQAFGQSLPVYVTQLLREAIVRDGAPAATAFAENIERKKQIHDAAIRARKTETS